MARGRARNRGTWLTVGMGLMGLCLAPSLATAADGELSAWQEITVLTVTKLEGAVANCGFSIAGRQLNLLLVSAGLSLDDVHNRARSKSLQQQIDEVTYAFRTNREAACGKAWDTFGPDGSARGYLEQ